MSNPRPKPDADVTVEVMDLRFGTPLSPGFVATAVVNSRLQVVRTWFTFGAAKPR